MQLKRHIPFLKKVFTYSISAFGGPQGHLIMMKKHFVDDRRDITESELLDFNSFTQLLPGPSSSQTVMLIGLKRGGTKLGLLTMLIWVIPASILMGGLSFLVYYLGMKNSQFLQIFDTLQPVSIGFIAFAALLFSRKYLTSTATWLIAIFSIIISFIWVNPWTFPILIILGAIFTTMSSRRIPDVHSAKRKPIKWRVLWIFLGVFSILAILASLAKSNDWVHGRAFILMENFYRFGSIIFGGGQVLLPMMLYQFVYRYISSGITPLISADQIITGYGLVNSIPGPVYSLAPYVGGMILAPWGWPWQLLGIIIGMVFIFLPGILLILFLFPIYQNLQYHVYIYRALEGVRSVITGILWGSTAVLWQNTIWNKYSVMTNGIWYVLGMTALAVATFLLLKYEKLNAQKIVLIALIIGTFLLLLS